jgi:hypothetical protein
MRINHGAIVEGTFVQPQYPPFGQLPCPVGPYNVDIRMRSADTAVTMGSFLALPTGILATLRFATRNTTLVEIPFSFDIHPIEQRSQFELSAQVRLAHSEAAETVPASHVTNSGGGVGLDGIKAGYCVLWFPMLVEEIASPVVITASWPEAQLADRSVTLPEYAVRAAADAATLL